MLEEEAELCQGVDILLSLWTRDAVCACTELVQLSNSQAFCGLNLLTIIYYSETLNAQ